MSTQPELILPLQGRLIEIEGVPTPLRRIVAMDLFCLFALMRRTNQRRPASRWARMRTEEILSDHAAGGGAWSHRQQAIADHVEVCEAKSPAAKGLRIGDVCDYLCTGMTFGRQRRRIAQDCREIVEEPTRLIVRDALVLLLGLEHRPGGGCDCPTCQRLIAGDWSGVIRRDGTEALIRELYEEAVLVGFPEMKRLTAADDLDLPDWV